MFRQCKRHWNKKSNKWWRIKNDAIWFLFFGIALGQLLLRHIDNLNKAFQQSDLSAAQGQALVSMTLTTLQTLRNQDSFDIFWKKIEWFSFKSRFKWAKSPKKKKAPKRFQIGHGKSEFLKSVSNLYRQHYYEALDLIIIASRTDSIKRVYKNL